MARTAAKTGAKSTFTFDDVKVEEARMVKGFPYTVESIDCTHLESDDDFEESIPGDHVKTGEIEIDCAFGYNQEALFRTKMEAKLVDTWSYVVFNRATYTGTGFITSMEPKEAKRNEAYTHTIKVRVSGKPTRAVHPAV